MAILTESGEQLLLASGGAILLEDISLSNTFSYGSTNVIDSPTAFMVNILGQSTLTVNAPANISATVPSPYGFSAPAVMATRSTINVTGGTLTGVMSSNGGATSGEGLLTGGCVVRISGGTFTGGPATSTSEAGSGASLDGGTFSISGGSFAAGSGAGASPYRRNKLDNGFEPVGYALVLGVAAGGTIGLLSGGPITGTISGGTFSSPNYALVVSVFGTTEPTVVTVSGGAFSGPILLRSFGHVTLNFVGASPLSYSSGTLSGTLSDGHAISSAVVVETVGGPGLTVSSSGNTTTFSF